jgi:hypothetical protein
MIGGPRKRPVFLQAKQGDNTPMKSEEEIEHEIVTEWSASEIALSACGSVLENSTELMDFLREGVELLTRIVVSKKMDMTWKEQSYKEMYSFDESVRVHLQIANYFAQQMAEVTALMIECVEDGTKGRKAVDLIQGRIDKMYESIQEEIGEKWRMLQNLGNEED